MSNYTDRKTKQKIWLSRTRSGIPGIFTGNTLVWSIGEDEFAKLVADPLAFAEYAAKYQFAVDEAHNLDQQKQEALQQQMTALVVALEDAREWIETGKVDGVGFDEQQVCESIAAVLKLIKES